MASLEIHYGLYRIVFRYAGQKFCRSLKTDKERTANAALARVDDNLRRLELGQLVLPTGADVAAFVLSDGRLDHRPVLKSNRLSTLAGLLDEFLAKLTPGSLEATTEHCLRIHVRHFCPMDRMNRSTNAFVFGARNAPGFILTRRLFNFASNDFVNYHR
jgi:hypothetical protein